MAGEKVVISFEVDSKGALEKVRALKKELGGTEVPAKKASAGIRGLSGSFQALGAAIAAAGITRGLHSMVQAFAVFEQQSVNVQNITGYTSAEMQKLNKAILVLPPTLGRASDLMRGLYQTLSSGVPKDNAIDFLVANAKAAKGNLADLNTTINASSSVLAAYNLSTSETTSVLDAMTKTVDLGKLTFSDMAQNIGKGISIAASAGVSYQELMATMAALTLSGLSVEEAMTGIRNILVSTIKTTPVQAKMMKELGVDMSVAAIKAKGFGGYMADLATKVSGNTDATAALFPNIRAMNAAMSLASTEGAARLQDMLEQVQNSAGKVEENFKRMSATVAEQMEAVSVQWEKAKISLGETLAPALLAVTTLLVKLPMQLTLATKVAVVEILKLAMTLQKFAEKGSHGPWGGLGKLVADMGAGASEEITTLNAEIATLEATLASFTPESTAATVATEKMASAMEEAAKTAEGLTKQAESTAKELEKLAKSAVGSTSEEMAKLVDKTLLSTAALENLSRIDPKPLHEWAGEIKKIPVVVDESFSALESTFSDLLGKGFTGELESFADLWNEIWQDLAKSMTGILGKAFDQWMIGGQEGGLKGLMGGFGDAIKENKLGAGIGGVGMMYGGYQQGGTGGILQGMMGGAMSGASLGSLSATPFGMVAGAIVGAIVGGVMAAFGGAGDDPAIRFSAGPGGVNVGNVAGQSFGRESQKVWERNVNQLMTQTENAYRGALKLFEDKDLFDLLGTIGSLYDMRVEMTPNELAKWIEDIWLPEQLGSKYGEAFKAGLGGLGMQDSAISSLFRELAAMPGVDRITALTEFVMTLKGITELAGRSDWNSVLDAVGEDSITTFVNSLGDVRDQMDMLAIGWDQMSLTERASDVRQIGELFESALQGTINLLKQIDGMRESINRGWFGVEEQLNLSGMNEFQQNSYYTGRITELLDALGTAGSMEEIQRINSELMGYVQTLMGSVDLGTGMDGGWGQTWRKYLEEVIAQAKTLANQQLDVIEGEVRTAYEELVERLNNARDALIGFADAVGGSPWQPGDTLPPIPTIKIPVTVNITNATGFDLESYIESVVAQAMYDQQQSAIN